jgi:type II secretory pathway pseudopilin PulG
MIARITGRAAIGRTAFTLMEIVLAIALTSVVMYLLTTAIELYMVRVDSSRSRVESAQLARTLLDQIAGDLGAVRLYGSNAGASGQAASSSSSSSPGTGSGTSPAGGSQSSGAPTSGAGSASSAAPGDSALFVSEVQGLYGTVEELRIDRAAYPNWQRAARQVEPDEPSTAVDFPTSVRYFFVDGDRLSAAQLAERGVMDELPAGTAAGLYCETLPTAAVRARSQAGGGPVQADEARLELLAPETVKFELAYYDGEQYLDAWDSAQSGALPLGIEIRLTLLEPRLQDSSQPAKPGAAADNTYRESEMVEYRRFVRIASISPPQPAELLLPAAGGNAAGGGRPSGQGPAGGGPGGPGGAAGQGGAAPTQGGARGGN